MEQINLGIKKRDKDNSQGLLQTYHLVQYTPYIHFQHPEQRPCLRASEVKPRLDRFIFELEKTKRFEKIYENAYSASVQVTKELVKSGKLSSIPEEWKQKKENNKRGYALNYKLSFYTKEEPDVEETWKYTSYFGNMGDNGVKKKFVMSEKGVEMNLICSDPSLKMFIDYILPGFFMLNCFGTRSTKGFGSYGIENAEYGMDGFGKNYVLQFVNRFYTIDESGNGKDHITTITTLSNMMKAGINFHGYYKGRIFRYYTEKGIGSDKAFIKQKILPGIKDKNSRSEEGVKYKEFVYSRAMLGLSEKYEFRKGPKTEREGIVKIENTMVNGCEVNKKTKIERFNNAIHFVPNKGVIFIVPTDIPKKMKSAEFKFAHVIEDKNGKLTKEVKKDMLKTPEEFDLIGFLDYFKDEFNKKKNFEKAPDSVKNLLDRKTINVIDKSGDRL